MRKEVKTRLLLVLVGRQKPRGRSSDTGVFVFLSLGMQIRGRRLSKSFQVGRKEPETIGKQKEKVVLP